MAAINYHPSQNTNKAKLAAVYSIIQQMNVERNRQWVGVKADRVNLWGRWQTYLKDWRGKLRLLLDEQQYLRGNLFREAYPTKEDWDKVETSNQYQAYITIFGDKEALKVLDTLATSESLDEIKTVDVTKVAVTLNG